MNRGFTNEPRYIRPPSGAEMARTETPIVGVPDVARTYRAPVVDAERMAMTHEGNAKIGQGLADAGNSLSKIAQIQLQAINVQREAEADTIMTEAETEMQTAWAKDQDETKWQGHASTAINRAKERIGGLKLSLNAKVAIGAKLQQWEAHRSGQAQVMSAQESVSKAKGVIGDRLELATETGNRALFDEVSGGAVKSGFMTAEGAKLGGLRFDGHQKQKAKQAEAEAEKAEFDDAYGVAVADPVGWKADPQNAKPDFTEGRWKGKATLWNRLHGAASQRENEIHGEVGDKIAEGIVTGAITGEKALDAAFPNLKPAIRAQALADLGSMAARKSDAVRNGPEGMKEWVRQYRRAQEWKADTNKPEELAGLLADVRIGVPGDLQREITQIVHQKFGSKDNSGLKARPEIQGAVSKALDQVFSIRARPTRTVLDAAQAKLTEAKKLGSGEAEQKALESAQQAHDEASESLIFAQAELESKMSDFYKQKPDATMDEAKKEMARILPEGTRSSFLDSLDALKKKQPSTTGTVTSYGYADDSTPDSNSAAGIGIEDRKIEDGDLSISPDVERDFAAKGIKPGDSIMLVLKNGEKIRTRWQDRTAQDSDFEPGGKYHGSNIKGPLRGRYDLYSPGGKHKRTGSPVVSWEPAPPFES